MARNKSKHKDIARIDQESKRTYGWYVRVRFHGKTHSKFFSDKKSGGRDLSLLAAIAWRNETEKQLGKPRTDRHMVTKTKVATGVVGVRLNEKLGRYEVSWVDRKGKQGKTSVALSRHGKEGAFKRACEIRARKEAERLAAPK
ncbi:MAG: AP2/ERF family transcription factor [Desulfurivibrionaceae bacterium]|nr:AP2/ERF family transcription factor [Desulfobulbales bacterium]MDT8335080.1 AP2/ERF family transcription factor [Desulfurivibrionaceae bacterium]